MKSNPALRLPNSEIDCSDEIDLIRSSSKVHKSIHSIVIVQPFMTTVTVAPETENVPLPIYGGLFSISIPE